MKSFESKVKELIEEVLKVESLFAAEQITRLVNKIFVEEGKLNYIEIEKQEQLQKLLNDLNHEIQIIKESLEARKEKVTGYKVLIKPFADVFYYFSENIHEEKAKNLSLEIAKFLLTESASKLMKEIFQEENISKLKSIAKDTITNGEEKLKSLLEKVSETKVY